MVRADTELRCTDTYWFPAFDVAVALGIASLAIFTDGFIESECDEGDGGACSTGTRVLAGAVYSSPFTISAAYGTFKATDCRLARRWQRRTVVPPSAGRPGDHCVPTYRGPPQCDAGLACVAGRCANLRNSAVRTN